MLRGDIVGWLEGEALLASRGSRLGRLSRSTSLIGVGGLGERVRLGGVVGVWGVGRFNIGS